MKLFKRNEKKATQKLPMTGKVKRGFRFYCMAVLAAAYQSVISVCFGLARDEGQNLLRKGNHNAARQCEKAVPS